MKTNMRIILRSAVLLLAFAGTVRAQEPTKDAQRDSTLQGEIRYRFLDIPWGASASAVRAQLSSHGFTASATDRDGDIPFTGTILGRQMTGWAMMSPTDGLAKMLIVFETGTFGGGYRDLYQEVVNTMTEKYGGGDDHTWFESPYESGDGYEDTAIRVGKGHVYTLWRGVDESTGLLVSISKALGIDVSYESALWHKEVLRRRSHAF